MSCEHISQFKTCGCEIWHKTCKDHVTITHLCKDCANKQYHAMLHNISQYEEILRLEEIEYRRSKIHAIK